MIVGILSDTHNRTDMMAAAMRVLQNHGAEFFIHCGDVGGEHILDFLMGVRAAFVWGNTDWDHAHLQRYAQTMGVPCYGPMADLNLDGKRIIAIHGDDHRLRQRLLAEQQCDYLLQGHTHVRDDQRIGRIRLINPGALHRASVKTVATLDLPTDQLQFLPVTP